MWYNEHDKNLCLRSYYVKEVNNIYLAYENGDTYTGCLSRGKKHGFGVFNEYSTHFVYNGNWEVDMV